MSFEGEEERLCVKGHHYVADVHGPMPRCCPVCNGAWEWCNIIDHTNGYCKTDPSTYPAKRIKVGEEDVECTDHRGNKYYRLHVLWAPAVISRWQRY